MWKSQQPQQNPSNELATDNRPADQSNNAPKAPNGTVNNHDAPSRRTSLDEEKDTASWLDSAPKRVAYLRMDPATECRLSHVDGSLVTHVILAFARLDTFGHLVLARPEDASYLGEVPEFKRRYPHVKVMISVFNEHEFNGFPRAATASDNRQRFARSSMDFLQRHQLDGLDLDWEFPNFHPSFFGAREHERQGLTKILKQLRSAIVENFYDRQVAEQNRLLGRQSARAIAPSHAAAQSSVEPYLLSVAVAGQEAVLRASYELKQIASLCDWLNIMSYDYFLFKAYAPFTGPNSPLYPLVEPYVPVLSKLSLSWTVNKLLREEQLPRDKIVMGIPTYARAYRLMFRSQQPAPFALAYGSKGGRIGDYLDYREVCKLLERADTLTEWDARARVPYLVTDDGYTWVSYENGQSVREKVRFVANQRLAGYMTWNLNSDDFTNRSFPLHRAMQDEMSAVRAALVASQKL